MKLPIRKPHRGTRLNHSHNLVRNLLTCLVLVEHTGSIAGNNVLGKSSGEISGATWRAGEQGSELDFSNSTSDVVDLGVPFLGSEQTELSIECILRINTLFTLQIIAENGSSVDSFFLAKDNANLFSFLVSGAGTSGRKSTNVVTPGVYYHVIGTWTPGSYPDLYVDGQLDNGATSGVVLNALVDGDSNLELGKRPGSTAISFNGGISLFRIYNKALSANEVTQLYRDPFEMFFSWDYRFLAGTIKQIDLQQTNFTLLNYTLSTLFSLLLQSGQAALLDFAIQIIEEIILQETKFTFLDHTSLILVSVLLQSGQAALLDFAIKTTAEIILQEIGFTFYSFEPVDIDFLNAIINTVVRKGFSQ